MPSPTVPEANAASAAFEISRLEAAQASLQARGLPADASVELAPAVLRGWEDRSLWKAATARAAGVAWDKAGRSYFEHDFLKDPEQARALFDGPLYRGRTVLNAAAPDAVIGNAAFKKRHVKLFAAEFVSLPMPFFKLGDPRVGIPEDAQLFSMSVPPAQMREIFGEDYDSVSFTHFENSFAYVRFHLRGADVMVTEIQSEVYKKIKDPELKARYRHWSRVLLLAFEDHIERAYFAPHGDGRLLIAGEDYQLRRWRKPDEPGLDAGLARMLYKDLPSMLGYQAVEGIEHAVEWPGHLEGAEASIPLPIEAAWSRSAAEIRHQAGPFRSEFKRLLQTTGENRFAAAYEALSSAARALAVGAPLPSSPLPSVLLEGLTGFDRVAQTPLALSQIAGMTPDLIRAFFDTLRFVPPYLFTSVLDPATTLISRSAAGQAADVESLEEAGPGMTRAHRVHDPIAQRHPRLNLEPAAAAAEGRSVGYKGGGAQVNAAAGYETKYTLQVPASGERLPIYRALDLRGEPPKTGSHRFWGGQSRDDAEIEFRNHLALHQLMLAVDGGPAAAAIPYDVGIPKSLPVWSAAGSRQVDQKAYRDEFLGGVTEEFAVFRAVTRASVRISNGVLALASEAVGIPRFLKAVYEAWGETLLLPERGDGDAMAYLRHVHLDNRAAAERIIAAIEAKTLRTIAAVHGAGGHLGGKSIELLAEGGMDYRIVDPPIGAPQGGAPDMRNMTVTGEMLDLDRSVYLPWAPRPDFGGDMRRDHETALAEMQKSDLLYWEASMYWMRNMLRGRTLKEGHDLLQYPFGNPQDGGIYTVSPGYDLEAENALRLVRTLKAEQPFFEDAHNALYADYVARGRAFRETTLPR
jgi:hypothetical protein